VLNFFKNNLSHTCYMLPICNKLIDFARAGEHKRAESSTITDGHVHPRMRTRAFQTLLLEISNYGTSAGVALNDLKTCHFFNQTRAPSR